MDFKPLFIVGIARSGTNLLARLLDGHPAVAVGLDPFLPWFKALRNALVARDAAPEMRKRFFPASPFGDYYFDADGPALLDLLLSADPTGLHIADADQRSLRASVVTRTALESSDLSTRMDHLQGADYREFLRCGLEIIARSKGDVRWAGCKEVWVIEFVPMLAHLFPQARFYAIERDPRAIVASLLALARKDPTQAAHAPSYMRHWRKQIALARRFEADAALAGRFRSVSYEALAGGPEAEAERLCAELGIGYRPEMLRLAAGGWGGNSSHEHATPDVYTASVDHWRGTLPERVAQAVDFHCGPEMRLTGYREGEQASPRDMLSYLVEAGRAPGSWRSDTGDALRDFGDELSRHALLAPGASAGTPLERRCFLFSETLNAIRRAALAGMQRR